MISLKQPAEEPNEVAMTAPQKASYGYGTCIQLEEEHVKQLAIGNLQAGTRVRIVAFGVIESVRVDVGEGEGKMMSIQLTDREATQASQADGAANKMYPQG